jgi:PAS domain S-box-containing protein
MAQPTNSLFEESMHSVRSGLARWPPLLLVAVALGAAAAVRVLLDPLWGTQYPFLPFFPAILICASGAGWRYGALATAGAVALVVMGHPLPVDVPLLIALAVFVLANAGMVMLAESARRARARAEYEAALAHESEHRFEVMADSAPLLIWVHDEAGEIEFVNRGWEEFFGVSQEEARRGDWRGLVHPEDAPRYAASFATAFARREPFQARARVRRADGAWRWVESVGMPRLSIGGRLLSYVGTSQDVTERITLEREREVLLESERAARTEAENATRAKDDFLATLSHELRTPLSVILLWSRILVRKYGAANEDLRKGLTLIADNGTALSRLIADLLDMSRIVSGRVLLDTRPLDVVEIVTQAVASHRPAAEAKRITLALELKSDPAIVLGDATRLQQVLWNLLSNAIKFTPERGHIWVTAGTAGEMFFVEVRDDGEGISPEFLPQVFNRFRQADSSSTRRFGGLGLGLAIVKQLVDLHGGTIRAESEGAGRGASFRLELPVHARSMDVDMDVDATGTWRRLDPEVDLNSRLEGLRVLAVEDQPDMLESLRRMLEDQGASVIPVTSGRTAFELLRDRPHDFDVLVSDIGMPQMDGYELIRKVRGELGLAASQMPAVAITAYARDEDRARALRAGFQAHLIKPYQVAQLIKILHGLRAAPPARSKSEEERTSGMPLAL